MKLKPHEPCQMWKFNRVVDSVHSVSKHHASTETQKMAQSTLPPITAETVIIGEADDCTTITRTTTTTTITTITTVTKAPRERRH